jgi:hypothetical protein
MQTGWVWGHSLLLRSCISLVCRIRASGIGTILTPHSPYYLFFLGNFVTVLSDRFMVESDTHLGLIYFAQSMIIICTSITSGAQASRDLSLSFDSSIFLHPFRDLCF